MANHRSSLILESFQSRNPHFYKTDINLIERVQRGFTKRLLGLKDISYHDRLVILDDADTLDIRHIKMDLLMLF